MLAGAMLIQYPSFLSLAAQNVTEFWYSTVCDSLISISSLVSNTTVDYNSSNVLFNGQDYYYPSNTNDSNRVASGFGYPLDCICNATSEGDLDIAGPGVRLCKT